MKKDLEMYKYADVRIFDNKLINNMYVQAFYQR